MRHDDSRLNNPLYTIIRVDDSSDSAQRCPVCNGTGYVDAGFYTQTSGQWSSTGGTEQCRSCCGKGYVVV